MSEIKIRKLGQHRPLVTPRYVAPAVFQVSRGFVARWSLVQKKNPGAIPMVVYRKNIDPLYSGACPLWSPSILHALDPAARGGGPISLGLARRGMAGGGPLCHSHYGGAARAHLGDAHLFAACLPSSCPDTTVCPLHEHPE